MLISFHEEALEVATESLKEEGLSVFYGNYTFVAACRTFKKLLIEKYAELETSLRSYNSGLTRIEIVEHNIADLKKQLAILEPSMDLENEKLEANIAMIEEEAARIKEANGAVSQSTEDLNQEKAILIKERGEIEKELADLQYILDKALQALQKISRQDITELRTFSSPPKAI